MDQNNQKTEKLPLLTDEAVDGVFPFKFKRGVDVQETWRKYGWVPPSEQKNA